MRKIRFSHEYEKSGKVLECFFCVMKNSVIRRRLFIKLCIYIYIFKMNSYISVSKPESKKLRKSYRLKIWSYLVIFVQEIHKIFFFASKYTKTIFFIYTHLLTLLYHSLNMLEITVPLGRKYIKNSIYLDFLVFCFSLL